MRPDAVAETHLGALALLCHAGSGPPGTRQLQSRHPRVSWKLPRFPKSKETGIGDGLVHLLAHLCNELASSALPEHQISGDWDKYCDPALK